MTFAFAFTRRSAGSPSKRPAGATARLPARLHAHVAPQRYDDYTPEDHDVWATMVERHERGIRELAPMIYEPYLVGLRSLRLDRARLPSTAWLNRKLVAVGWSTACVDGYLPPRVYAELIAHRVFPISRDIRRARHLDFSPTPDLVHDVFGHVPLLFDAHHRAYLRELAMVMAEARGGELDDQLHAANRALGAIKADPDAAGDEVRAAEAECDRVQRRLAESPSQLTAISRLFLWTVEFGLIGHPDDFRVQGAGLLSSLGEIASLTGHAVNIERYSIKAAARDIHFSAFQGHYYVFRDYDDASSVLRMQRRAGGA
jgi:phenylalanine-4-hydroxylase